jgi:hypothetical protein
MVDVGSWEVTLPFHLPSRAGDASGTDYRIALVVSTVIVAAKAATAVARIRNERMFGSLTNVASHLPRKKWANA